VWAAAPQGGFNGDPTAHAARREIGQCLHEFRDISTVPLDGAFGCCARTCPMSVQTDGDRRWCDHPAALPVAK
jgi:hypothetical protein